MHIAISEYTLLQNNDWLENEQNEDVVSFLAESGGCSILMLFYERVPFLLVFILLFVHFQHENSSPRFP